MVTAEVPAVGCTITNDEFQVCTTGNTIMDNDDPVYKNGDKYDAGEVEAWTEIEVLLTSWSRRGDSACKTTDGSAFFLPRECR